MLPGLSPHPLDRAEGGVGSRISIGDFVDDRHLVVAQVTKPLFSHFHVKVVSNEGKEYWVSKDSLKRRFSTTEKERAILQRILPGVSVEKPVLFPQTPEAQCLAGLMEKCSKSKFLAAEAQSILDAAKGPFPGQEGLLIQGKKQGLVRSILIGPLDDSGMRKRHVLMTHVRKGNDKFLGNGVHGDAKYAIDLDTGSIDVVKICKNKNERRPKDPADSVEIEIMQTLRGKEGIVQLKSGHKTRDKVYIVMENCDQGDCETALKTHNTLSFEQALGYSYDLVSGLDALQKNQITHRDLALRNIFLKNENGRSRAKIGDFGVAFSPATEKGDKVFAERQYKHQISYEVERIGGVIHVLFNPKAEFSQDYSGAGIDPRVHSLLQEMLPLVSGRDADLSSILAQIEAIAKAANIKL